MTEGTIDYDLWYLEVPAVMDTKQSNIKEQMVQAWVGGGAIPGHRRPGGRKQSFLCHEIFEWLLSKSIRASQRSRIAPLTMCRSRAFREADVITRDRPICCGVDLTGRGQLPSRRSFSSNPERRPGHYTGKVTRMESMRTDG